MRSPVLIGAFCLILSELLFAGVGALVKHLSATVPQAQLVFFRNLFALVVVFPWLFKAGIGGLKTAVPGLHLYRSITGLLAMYCFFYVLANMALAPAMMALLTAPFLVPLVARFWLKEHITPITAIAILIGFGGVFLVLEPTSQSVNQYVLLALLCAFLVAINKCAIRKMSATEPSPRIVFMFAAIATLISLFPALYSWQPVVQSSWLWLSVMGVLAGFGQLLMTKAFQLASPVKIGLLTYSSVVFAAMLGYGFWDEPVAASLLLGSALIVFAANMTIRQRWI